MALSKINKFTQNIAYSLVATGFTLPELKVNRVLELIYLRKLLNDLKINCIIDVGANTGQFANSLRKIGYRGYIFSFEPLKHEFSILSEMFKKDKLWKGFNFALGSEESIQSINVDTRFSVLSSFLSPIYNKSDSSWKVAIEEVEIKRLDKIFDTLIEGIPEPRIFLKMDTQGYDLEVFKGAEGCLERILGLQSEISVDPLYENMPHYTEALKVYEKAGFILMNLYPVLYTQEYKNILEFNCMMAKLK